jgi:undecaprenyl-diphosphatase
MPAILGAGVVEARNLLDSQIGLPMLFSSFLVSAFVGYLSLKLLWKTVLERRFHLFAYYCWAVGLIIILARI